MGLVVGARDAIEQQLRELQASHAVEGFSTSDFDLEASLGQLQALVAAAEEEHVLYPRRPRLMADGEVSPDQWHHESAPR